MKSYSMRQIQVSLARILLELPVEVTRYGKVVAVLDRASNLRNNPEIRNKKDNKLRNKPHLIDSKPMLRNKDTSVPHKLHYNAMLNKMV